MMMMMVLAAALSGKCLAADACSGAVCNGVKIQTSSGGRSFCCTDGSFPQMSNTNGVPSVTCTTSQDCGECAWTIQTGKFRYTMAAGLSTTFTLAAAKTKCAQLGPDSCRGVVCTGEACTVREGKDVHDSPSEVTHSPNANCYTTDKCNAAATKVCLAAKKQDCVSGSKECSKGAGDSCTADSECASGSCEGGNCCSAGSASAGCLSCTATGGVCDKCPKGPYKTSAGVCASCPTGKSAPAGSSSENDCILAPGQTCNYDTTVPPANARCLSGYCRGQRCCGSDAGVGCTACDSQGDCLKCSINFYKPSSFSKKCDECPDGKYNPTGGTGSSSCVAAKSCANDKCPEEFVCGVTSKTCISKCSCVAYTLCFDSDSTGIDDFIGTYHVTLADFNGKNVYENVQGKKMYFIKEANNAMRQDRPGGDMWGIGSTPSQSVSNILVFNAQNDEQHGSCPTLKEFATITAANGGYIEKESNGKRGLWTSFSCGTTCGKTNDKKICNSVAQGKCRTDNREPCVSDSQACGSCKTGYVSDPKGDSKCVDEASVTTTPVMSTLLFSSSSAGTKVYTGPNCASAGCMGNDPTCRFCLTPEQLDRNCPCQQCLDNGICPQPSYTGPNCASTGCLATDPYCDSCLTSEQLDLNCPCQQCLDNGGKCPITTTTTTTTTSATTPSATQVSAGAAWTMGLWCVVVAVTIW